MKNLFLVFSVFATGIMLFSFALSGENNEHKHSKPPFVTACENLNENDACTFTMKDKNCSGTCKTKERKDGEKKLICISETEGCKFEGRHHK